MAIAHVQDATASGSASVVVALPSAVGSGNTLIATTFLNAYNDTYSVTDNLGNRWIQAATSYTTTGGAEIFYARGVQPGVASVTFTLETSGSVQVNVAEYSGVWFVDPLDQWSQNYGTSASPIATTLTPRGNNELIVASTIVSGGSVAAIPSGYSSLTTTGSSVSGAYFISSSSVATAPTWRTSASTASWATVAACFIPGANGLNPRLQFPETIVQMSTTSNYLAPLQGIGAWTNISHYVQSMSIGPFGRQHELDRVQSTTANISVNNRDGSFNPWNTSSFLYANGIGLTPMTPLSVTAAWNGITYPKYYGYTQSIKPEIRDVLNVNATIQCNDILQIFSLKYLSNNFYAQLVAADGGSNLAAYYRCGDEIGSYSVRDYSSNTNTGSLVAGNAGLPSFGLQGPILYDPNTSVDLTNGTKAPMGAFTTIDNTTEPPTANQPLAASVAYSFYSTGTTLSGQSVTGSDGNQWVAAITSSGSGNGGVIKITPSGTQTFYSFGSADTTFLCLGGDNNVWVVDSYTPNIWKVTPTGTTTSYSLGTGGTDFLGPCCLGPDGNVWVIDSSANQVIKVTPSGSSTKYTVTTSAELIGICKGSDNNLWINGYTLTQNHVMWRVTTSGSVSTFTNTVPGGAYIYNCTTGPDGNLYIPSGGGVPGPNGGSYVTKMNTSGSVLANFSLPYMLPTWITSGADGYLWMCDDQWGYGSNLGSSIIRMDTNGNYSRYSLSSYGASVVTQYISPGPSNTIWASNVNTHGTVNNGEFVITSPGASPWTLECWFQWNSASIPTVGTVKTVPNGIVMHASNSTGGGAFEVQLGNVTNSPYNSLPGYVNFTPSTTYTSAVFVGNAQNQFAIGIPYFNNIFDGNWHHLVVNSGVQGTNMNLWIDGVQCFAPIVSGGTVSNPTGISIGGTPQRVSGFNPLSNQVSGGTIAAENFPGNIAEVALYNGMNLSPTQIANHYQTATWFRQQEFGAANGGVSAGRLNKVVEVLGLNPAVVLNVPYQFRTLLYAETNVLTTTSGLNYLQTQTETEPGIIFQSPNGTISAYNRQYQYLSSNSNTSQAIFGDYPAATYRYEGQSLSIDTDDLDIWNEIQSQSGRAGSQLQEWGPNQYPYFAAASTAAHSASVYANRTMQGLTSLQQQYDGDALALAQNYAKWYNLPIQRISTIKVNSQANGGQNITQILGRGLMDQITVSYTGQTPGPTFTQNSLIESISDAVDMSLPAWTTTFSLSPYELLMSPTVLGSYQFGVSQTVLTL